MTVLDDPKEYVVEVVRYSCGNPEHAHLTYEIASRCIEKQKRLLKRKELKKKIKMEQVNSEKCRGLDTENILTSKIVRMLICEGMFTKDLSKQLGMSESTLIYKWKTICDTIFSILNCESNKDLYLKYFGSTECNGKPLCFLRNNREDFIDFMEEYYIKMGDNLPEHHKLT